jgi:hypothetical protein
MRVFVFGDSYSVEFNDPNLYPPGHHYCDWKGYIPKKYYHHLSERFGSTEIFNYAISGNDNDNIFESFTEHYKDIQPDDIVIFGWTSISRFSCTNKNGEWKGSISFNDEWVNKNTLNRSSLVYYNRQMKLIEFINQILLTQRVVHWTWRWYVGMFEDKSISYETNGEVNDFHYSEGTHRELYERMINELNNQSHINIDLWNRNEYIIL